MESGSEGTDSGASWVEWYVSQRGNEYFCEVDEDYILDKFNLTGLMERIPNYQLALDLITDSLENDLDAEMWEQIDYSAKILYGLVHARWILTNKGIQMMAEKLKRGEFGKCPRVFCEDQAVIPVGISDLPGNHGVKLYCPRCEDIYVPPTRRQMMIDGAYFTTSLPHILLLMCPGLLPKKTTERYVPKIFGFRVHSIAEEHRFQDRLREETLKKKEMMIEE
jgi:casein kinase II subunit beta